MEESRLTFLAIAVTEAEVTEGCEDIEEEEVAVPARKASGACGNFPD